MSQLGIPPGDLTVFVVDGDLEVRVSSDRLLY
jgi:hypothetical protein